MESGGSAKETKPFSICHLSSDICHFVRRSRGIALHSETDETSKMKNDKWKMILFSVTSEQFPSQLV